MTDTPCTYLYSDLVIIIDKVAGLYQDREYLFLADRNAEIQRKQGLNVS